MSLHVQTEMVAPRESPFAEMALKGPVSRVFAVMSGQFVGSGEFPAAAFPVAVVGLLPRVGSQVRLQMRRLGVGLGAAGMRAGVRRRPLAAPSASSALLRRRSADISAAKAQQGAADGADTSGAHWEEEIGKLRGRGRRHQWMMMRVMRVMRVVWKMRMMAVHEIGSVGSAARHRVLLLLLLLLLLLMMLQA